MTRRVAIFPLPKSGCEQDSIWVSSAWPCVDQAWSVFAHAVCCREHQRGLVQRRGSEEGV